MVYCGIVDYMSIRRDNEVYMERMTVSLDEFLKYLLKKWKMVLAFLIVFILLFGASAKMLGKKIVISPSEEYLQLKEQEASISGYIENAPMMKIDSTYVQEIVIYISDISDRDALKNYFDSGNVWEGIEYEHYLYYIMELVTWTDGNAAKSAEIKIQHSEEAQCSLMAEFLSEKIHDFDEEAEVLVGTPYIASDESIADVQSWYKNRLNAIEGQLEYARAGYVIEVNLPVAILTGALVGGFTAIVVAFLLFVLNRKSQ